MAKIQDFRGRHRCTSRVIGVDALYNESYQVASEARMAWRDLVVLDGQVDRSDSPTR